MSGIACSGMGGTTSISMSGTTCSSMGGTITSVWGAQHGSAYPNSTITLTFWQIGKYINDFVLNNKHAEYGK